VPSPAAVWAGMWPLRADPSASLLSASLQHGPDANAAPVQHFPSAPLPWTAYPPSGPQDRAAWSSSPALQLNPSPPRGSDLWSSFNNDGQQSPQGASGDKTSGIPGPDITSRAPTPPNLPPGSDVPSSMAAAPAPAVDPFQIAAQRARQSTFHSRHARPSTPQFGWGDAAQRAWEGAKFGFGDQPLGFSADNIAKYPNAYLAWQPFVAPLDLALRSVPAAIYGAAGLASGLYEGFGGSPANAARLQRDIAQGLQVAVPEMRTVRSRFEPVGPRIEPAAPRIASGGAPAVGPLTAPIKAPALEARFRPPLPEVPPGDRAATSAPAPIVTPNPPIKLPDNLVRAPLQNSQLTFDFPSGGARTGTVAAESGGLGQAPGPGGTLSGGAPPVARARPRASAERSAQGRFDFGPDNAPAGDTPPAAGDRYAQPAVPATAQTVAAALRAAVTSGKINEAEAAFLRLSSARWQEGQRARLQAALEGNLPEYDKKAKTTYGFLVTNEGDVVPLRSGDPDPTYDYPAAKHVEGKAAIWIRKLSSTGGVVYHNNTGGVCGMCNTNVPTLLPEGAILKAVSPPNAVATKPTYQVAPKPWVGNAKTPVPKATIGDPQ
jgi:SCP1.201-like deaminase